MKREQAVRIIAREIKIANELGTVSLLGLANRILEQLEEAGMQPPKDPYINEKLEKSLHLGWEDL